MSGRFEKAIVHIGLGKTGSTTIQNALLAHAQELDASFSTYFPTDFSDPRAFAGNHSLFLRSMFAEAPEELQFNKVVGLDSRERALAADKSLLRQYQAGFESTSAKTLLLSAEGIGHFDGASLQRLARWLDSVAGSIEVIACIRHPRHALAAEIQQRVKGGGRLENLFARPPFYRYSELFARLEDSFSKEAIRVYDYAVPCHANTIVSTFFAKIGAPVTITEQEQERSNAGISHEATYLIDALNRLRPQLESGQVNPLRSVGDLAAFVDIPGSRFTPPQAAYETLDSLAAHELHWLHENYGLTLDAMGAGAGAEDVSVSFGDESVEAQALSISDLANSRARET